MTQNDKSEMKELGDFFAEIQDGSQDVPAHLTQRVLADAARVQPLQEQNQLRKRFGSRFLDAIGGWPAFGGLAAASCVGFWIGVSPPEGIIDPANLFLPTGVEAYNDPAELTGFGWDVLEG